jgi:hypothetical protein
MKQNFCTLFNTAYLSRGLVLYNSLLRYAPDFHLYVFAFDEHVLNYFQSENLPHLTVVSLSEFEDPELLRVKPDRQASEYCWTCTPSTISYCIREYNLTSCTYLDADICFYGNPMVLTAEMGTDSVQITEHRYSTPYDQSGESGKYCVQFITFRNTSAGMEVLRSWREDCIHWCYARVEDGKFGDQKYLDGWPNRYPGINILMNPGGGLAPWNIQQYRFSNESGKIKGMEISSGHHFEAVFYHFHNLKFLKGGVVSYTDIRYEINEEIKKIFYEPYIRSLLSAGKKIRSANPQIDSHGLRSGSSYLRLSFVTLTVLYFYYFAKYGDFSGKRLKNRLLHYHFHPVKID